MIAKQIKGTGFSGVIAYNEKKVREGEAKLLETNLSGRNTKEFTREFNLIKQLRPNLTRAVYHTSLNLSKNEHLSDDKFNEIALKYLDRMGFNDNQYILYRHHDTEHPHLHIVANRVKYSGDLVSESKDYERGEAVVRALEVEYGLERLQKTKKRSKSKLTKGEIERTLRTGEVPVRTKLQQKIDELMLSSETISQFIDGLLKEKIHPQFNISKTTNRISGVSFMMDGVIFKGSKLGKKYSWNSIKQYIRYEQDRDSAIIHKVNAGTARLTEREQESVHRDAVEARGHDEANERTKRTPEFDSKQSSQIEQSNQIEQETELDDEQSARKKKRKKPNRGYSRR